MWIWMWCSQRGGCSRNRVGWKDWRFRLMGRFVSTLSAGVVPYGDHGQEVEE